MLDGETLQEIADEIGLDLYNGRLEALCDETLRPYDLAGDIDAPVREAFRDIEKEDYDAWSYAGDDAVWDAVPDDS